MLSVQDAAKVLKVSTGTVYQLCKTERLAHARIGVGRGTIRIRQEDLDAYIASATVQSAAPTAPPPRRQRVKLKHLKIT